MTKRRHKKRSGLQKLELVMAILMAGGTLASIIVAILPGIMGN